MLIQKISLLLLLAFLTSTHGRVAVRLVGAQLAEIGEFPHQVSLRSSGNHFCGGTLIGRRHVLTAAHCVLSAQKKKLNGIPITAVVGTNSLATGGDSYNVVALISPADYESTNKPDWQNDIGIMLLGSEVELSDRVAIADLPTKDVETDDQLIVSGWGSTKGPKTPLAIELEKLTYKVISRDECRKAMPEIVKEIYPTYICTNATKGVGSCTGDSGGPVISNGILVGVVAGGIPCARGYPDIFTNVFMYLSFINSLLKQ